MNQHCGKHDRIFSESNPCLGCETEKAQGITQEKEAVVSLSAETKINAHIARLSEMLRKALGMN